MIVSSKGRYALLVCLDLAQQDPDAFISLREIAQRQQISMKYLESIVAVLNRSGLLLSHRGKGGGYRLSKPPQECSVQEILCLTEGSVAPVSCLEPGGTCDRSAHCITFPMWKQVYDLIDGYLQTVTLQDILDGKIPKVHMIPD